MKAFLTKQNIIDLVEEGNRIMPPSGFKKLRNIGRSCNLELIHDKQTNLRLFWNYQRDQMNALPSKDPFVREMIKLGRWEHRGLYPDVLQQYIRHIGCWEDYELLSSNAWDQLFFFCTSTFSEYGITTEGAVTPLILCKGDYEAHLKQWDKSHADKEALETSKKLHTTIEKLFEGVEPEERFALGSLIYQYATTEKGISWEELHNIIFKKQ